MNELHALIERAEEFLAAAQQLAGSGLNNAAFDDARHAAELAGKALLLQKLGSYPQKHQIAGELTHAGLLPPELEPRTVSRVLGAFTAGRYGFTDNKGPDEVAEAIAVAQALVAAVHQ